MNRLEACRALSLVFPEIGVTGAKRALAVFNRSLVPKEIPLPPKIISLSQFEFAVKAIRGEKVEFGIGRGIHSADFSDIRLAVGLPPVVCRESSDRVVASDATSALRCKWLTTVTPSPIR